MFASSEGCLFSLVVTGRVSSSDLEGSGGVGKTSLGGEAAIDTDFQMVGKLSWKLRREPS